MKHDARSGRAIELLALIASRDERGLTTGLADIESVNGRWFGRVRALLLVREMERAGLLVREVADIRFDSTHLRCIRLLSLTPAGLRELEGSKSRPKGRKYTIETLSSI